MPKIPCHIRNLGIDSIPCRQLVVRDLGIPYWGFIESYVTEFIDEFYKSDRQWSYFTSLRQTKNTSAAPFTGIFSRYLKSSPNN